MSFNRLDPQDFVISADSVVSPTWSGNNNTLTAFYTSSNQTSASSGIYYLDIYNYNPQLTSSAEVQFSIAYANKFGYGAIPYNGESGSSPTSTLYGQMRNLLLEDENSDFMFGNFTGSDFYIININRARYKEKLMPGSWEIKMRDGESTSTLKDNSPYVNFPTYYGTQRAYDIYLGGLSSTATPSGSHGLFFPDTSIILLNAAALDWDAAENYGFGINTDRTPNTNSQNPIKLYDKLVITDDGLDPHFTMMSEETITSNYIFVRARNSEFNYSENPSFISGSTGEVIHNSYINNPQTYITTIGLYNDSNELMAVSKLSKPLLKDFSKEALLRLRLDF